MSALDFTARGLALRAIARRPKLFRELADAQVADEDSWIESSGHAQPGIGTARYVADARANAQLQAEHPEAVIQTRNGRFYRLLPNTEGFITPEQMGCPAYAPGANAQPAIQAAVRYAEKMGYGVLFAQAKYELWAPLRNPTSVGAVDLSEDNTGFPIVVTGQVELRAGPGGTSFDRKMWNGGDPADHANAQAIAGGNTWRGGMFFIKGLTALPADLGTLPRLTVRGNWTFDGGTLRSATPGYIGSAPFYPLNPDGSGADIRDRFCSFDPGIYWDHDLGDYGNYSTRYTGGIELHGDIKITGFRGATFWGAGVGLRGKFYQRGKLEVAESDSGEWDLTCVRGFTVDIQNYEVHHVYQPHERTVGWDAWVGRFHCHDNTLGGNWHGGQYEVIEDATSSPVAAIDTYISERNGTATIFGDGLKVSKAIGIDNGFHLGQAQVDARGAEITAMTVIADRAVVADAVTMTSKSAVAGTMGTHTCRVRHLHLERTPYAIANGKYVLNPVNSSQSLGDNCFVDKITGYAAVTPFARTPAGVTNYFVGVGDMSGLTIASENQTTQNIETSPAIAYVSAWMRLTSTASGANTACTLPNMAGKLPRGSRLILFNDTAGTGTGMVTIGTANTLLRRRAHLPWRERIEFEWTGSRWKLLTTPFVLTGSVTANLQKGGAAIPAGDVSDEVTFTVQGARPGMRVEVTPASVINGDALLLGRVTGNDIVGIRAQNMNLGGTLATGSVAYRVELDWVS